MPTTPPAILAQRGTVPATITRVLAADDQPDVLEALRLLFRGAGIEGDFVASPGAVLERLQRQTYDLLLIDLNYSRDTTSGGEGLELVAGVRAIDPGLPIVVMTGWGTIETAVEAMRRGAKSFVQKPWNNTNLLDLVTREAADGRAARQRDAQHQREQDDARRIQQGLLPTTLPSSALCDLAATWRPASGYGGDCYDALPLGEEALGLLIADVCGKGLPAALLMSSLQAAVRAFAEPAAPPREVCGRVNGLLCRHMINGRFVTGSYLVLDPKRGTLRYTNAGHNPPLLVRASGEVVRLGRGGTVLGVFPGASYDEETLAIGPGDRLVLYTDGITEATARGDAEYGEERLVTAARRATSASALVDGIIEDVLGFTGGALQDDATVVAAVLRG